METLVGSCTTSNMPSPQDDSSTYYLRNSYTQHYLHASGSTPALNAKKSEDAFYQVSLSFYLS